MKLLRLMVFVLATVLLAGGYLVSQLTYAKAIDENKPALVATYAERVDVPLISVAALIVLVSCVVFTLFQGQKEEAAD